MCFRTRLEQLVPRSSNTRRSLLSLPDSDKKEEEEEEDEEEAADERVIGSC